MNRDQLIKLFDALSDLSPNDATQATYFVWAMLHEPETWVDARTRALEEYLPRECITAIKEAK